MDGRGWNADVELRRIALQERLRELPPPAVAVSLRSARRARLAAFSKSKYGDEPTGTIWRAAVVLLDLRGPTSATTRLCGRAFRILCKLEHLRVEPWRIALGKSHQCTDVLPRTKAPGNPIVRRSPGRIHPIHRGSFTPLTPPRPYRINTTRFVRF